LTGASSTRSDRHRLLVLTLAGTPPEARQSWFIWHLATAAPTAFKVSAKRRRSRQPREHIAYIAALLMGRQRSSRGDGPRLVRMLFCSASFSSRGANRSRSDSGPRAGGSRSASGRADASHEGCSGEADEEASRRIQDADRLKSQFLANMSHELRTQISSIIGFSEILIERLGDTLDSKHVGFLRHILTSGQHLLGIINDILDLSKIEAGKMEIYAEKFAVRPVIESVCTVMRGMGRTKMPTFVIETDPALPPIETDLAKFKQILYNLLSNAMKFAPPDAPISISAMHVGETPEDGTITISVRDEGIGIDPRNHDVIFEEFRQIDGTARREFGGTGLGLALVKKFVQLQGGWVRVDSAPGKGSTFSFTLPVHSRAAVVSHIPEIMPAEQGEERVLVVEDDAHAY
jgi:signal transduction histidine kinase